MTRPPGGFHRWAIGCRLGLALVAAGAVTPLAGAAAQVQGPATGSALDGGELTISLMTMGVGARVWERFGHNAILVEDRARHTAIAYNYGLFDFRQHNFLLRFIQGRMLYWMQGFDLASTLEIYRRTNRTVWLQELALRPPERRALRDFLEWNARPENRFYRYDYYRDNCSTRVRDAIDRVLGGRIRAVTDTIATGHTYRFQTARLTADDLPLYTGLLFALGESTDQELTAWQEMFLPLDLRNWIRRVTVADESGRLVPLVRSERVLFEGTEPAPPPAPPRRVPGYLIAGLLIGVGLWVFGRGAARSPAARTAFVCLAEVWTIVAGTAGALLASLWAFTDHVAAYRNENVLQASLFLVPLVVLLPLAARGVLWTLRPMRVLALLVSGTSLLGLGVKLLPAFSQHNAEILALGVPANLGLALGVLALTRRLTA